MMIQYPIHVRDHISFPRSCDRSILRTRTRDMYSPSPLPGHSVMIYHRFGSSFSELSEKPLELPQISANSTSTSPPLRLHFTSTTPQLLHSTTPHSPNTTLESSVASVDERLHPTSPHRNHLPKQVSMLTPRIYHEPQIFMHVLKPSSHQLLLPTGVSSDLLLRRPMHLSERPSFYFTYSKNPPFSAYLSLIKP